MLCLFNYNKIPILITEENKKLLMNTKIKVYNDSSTKNKDLKGFVSKPFIKNDPSPYALNWEIFRDEQTYWNVKITPA